jgi:hypothetical protein
MEGHPKRELHMNQHRQGFTPGLKAFHEVSINKELGYEMNDEIRAFIDKHIAEFNGKVEDKHGIPLMLFERVQDANKFADELSEKLNIHKEHISVKAQKFTR